MDKWKMGIKRVQESAQHILIHMLYVNVDTASYTSECRLTYGCIHHYNPDMSDIMLQCQHRVES